MQADCEPHETDLSEAPEPDTVGVVTSFQAGLAAQLVPGVATSDASTTIAPTATRRMPTSPAMCLGIERRRDAGFRDRSQRSKSVPRLQVVGVPSSSPPETSIGATLPAARERVNWCRNESHRSLTPGRVQPSRCRLRDALTITTSSSGARAVTNVGLPNVKNGVSTGTLIRPA